MSKPDHRPRQSTTIHPRLARERKTVRAMIDIYCRAHHQPGKKRCAPCQELLAFAEKRLADCAFQEEKPTCGNCPVHCYKASMREKIQEVMRFSGPRMLYHHPLLAAAHLLDKRRQPSKTAFSKKSDREVS